MLQTKPDKPANAYRTGNQPSQTIYFDSDVPKSPYELKEQLISMFRRHRIYTKEIVVLCIGSDRSTGDSLGPLIGYKLEKYHMADVSIYGTLQSPVHAANLAEKLDEIYSLHSNPFILAIDASLGTKDHIGYITLGNGPLRPGLGVNKDLPDVGDIHITGIVNFSGMMESLLLQTTRLSQVMRLADTISKAVLYGISEYFEM